MVLLWEPTSNYKKGACLSKSLCKKRNYASWKDSEVSKWIIGSEEHNLACNCVYTHTKINNTTIHNMSDTTNYSLINVSKPSKASEMQGMPNLLELHSQKWYQSITGKFYLLVVLMVKYFCKHEIL